MLFHVSVEADDPRHVAGLLAEILDGEAMPFPSVGEGSWVALAGDDRGTIVEVYHRGTELHIGADGVLGRMGIPRRNGATHFAMATPHEIERIYEIAAREGLVAKYCRRGNAFGVVEFWIDGCLMVEVLTPEMQAEYQRVMTIDNWKRMLAAAPMAEAA